MTTTMTDNNNDMNVSWHVVAFLDLLGQQDKLRQITTLPDQANAAEVEAFKQSVLQMYGPVKSLRTFFLNSIKSFSAPSDDKDIPEQFKEVMQQFRSCPIDSQTFSDSVIASVPLRTDISLFPCRAIFGVLSAAALAFLSCLAKGSPIRGGIDLGLAFNIDENEIYGPALARAYTLESKVAHYPRIVIGEELVRYLNAVATAPAATTEQQMNAVTAQSCIRLMTTDDDGHSILDYLGEEFRDSLEMVHSTADIVQMAYNFVLTESQKYQAEKNSKLGFRYTLLRNYFEDRLPNWGFELQAVEPEE